MYKKICYLTLDHDVKVTLNVSQYPLHLTHIPAKFGVATSNGLGEDSFTRKYIIKPLSLTFRSRHRKDCPVPSKVCDLCTCNV